METMTTKKNKKLTPKEIEKLKKERQKKVDEREIILKR
jgi:hypothetical protein